MRPLFVYVTGDPIALTRETRGGWASLIRETAGAAWQGEFRAIDVRGDAHLPAPEAAAGVVITGSAASVCDREPWMLRLEQHLRQAVANATPLLGICFGHQILGQALGGSVAKNPRGREIGSVEVELTENDPLLDDGARPFLANMTHMDTLVELPPAAKVLARTALERHAALRFSETAWGVQFHPEIDASVMRQYVHARRALIEGEGLDPDAIEARISDATPGKDVLRRFIEHAVRR